MRRGLPQRKEALLSSLSKFTKSRNLGIAKYLHESNSREQATESCTAREENGDQESHSISSSSSAEDEDLGHYTTALKQHGDLSSTVPEYDITEVSQHPPLFRASLSFKRLKVVGEGRSKKLAKHRASKLACSRLSIHPN